MHSRKFLLRWTSLGLAGILLSVIALGLLQDRWLNQLSQTEAARLAAGLEVSAHRIARDFDTEITRVLLYTQQPRWRANSQQELEDELAGGFNRWRNESRHGGLFEALLWVRRDLQVTEPEPAVRWLRLAAGQNHFTPISVSGPLPAPDRSKGMWYGYHRPLQAASSQLLNWPPPGTTSKGTLAHHQDWLLLVFDQNALAALMDTLKLRYFDVSGDDFDLGIRSTTNGEWLYRSSDRFQLTSSPSADAQAPMLRVIGRVENPALWDGFFGFDQQAAKDSAGLFLADETLASQTPWQLVIRHKEGSLAAAVARQKRRNTFISLAVLLLLAAAAVSTLVASRRAERLARDQFDFIAGVSHELRTPVSAIQSLSENLKDGLVQSPEQVERYGNQLVRQAARLRNLIEQALLLGPHGQRSAHPPQEFVDIAEVIDRAIDNCRYQIQDCEAHVECHVDERLPLVRASREGLTMAVRNLISNALKYGGEQPEVVIRARLDAAQKGLEISVSDRGMGVLAAERRRLFEPFFRGSRARSEQIEGAGLGLALVRELIEAHGGRVGLESKPGQGSRFAIRLPAFLSEVSSTEGAKS